MPSANPTFWHSQEMRDSRDRVSVLRNSSVLLVDFLLAERERNTLLDLG
jgi:hypothetical protein